MAGYCVYFLTNKNNEVMYVGITNDLERRLYEHRHGITKGFSQKYRTHKLVYYEIFDDPANAILREKQIKNWRRSKKDYLVTLKNPDRKDLSQDWYKPDPSATG